MSEKKVVRMLISVDIETDKPIDEIIKGLQRGIYRGLDTEPHCVAAPKDVKINYCRENNDFHIRYKGYPTVEIKRGYKVLLQQRHNKEDLLEHLKLKYPDWVITQSNLEFF